MSDAPSSGEEDHKLDVLSGEIDAPKGTHGLMRQAVARLSSNARQAVASFARPRRFEMPGARRVFFSIRP